MCLGHVHKPGDVTAGILLQAKDGRHSFFMDNDGQRKGWTSTVSPGNYQVTCGEDNEEAQDSMFLHATNGNIVVLATNGKLRLQASDIELVAIGEGGSKGNIKMTATENVSIDCKKFQFNAKNYYKLCTSGKADVIANGVAEYVRFHRKAECLMVVLLKIQRTIYKEFNKRIRSKNVI